MVWIRVVVVEVMKCGGFIEVKERIKSILFQIGYNIREKEKLRMFLRILVLVI